MPDRSTASCTMRVIRENASVMDATAPHHHIAIVGAGFAGLGMAIKLERERIDDFVILERADSGGTWRDNAFPGCGCGVPSHLYSFSFAPHPDLEPPSPSPQDRRPL